MPDELKTAATDANGKGGDAAKAVTETPAADDRDAEAIESETPEQAEIKSLRNFKEKALAEKSSAEAARKRNAELERELEDLRRWGQAPATGDPRQYEIQKQAEEAMQAYEIMAARAREGDLYAKSIVMGQRMLAEQLQQQSRHFELMAVPDEDRDEVQKLYDSGEYGSVQVARKHYLAAKRNRELETELEKLKSGKDQTREVERLKEEGATIRGVNAADTEKRTMAGTKYADELERLSSLGQYDKKKELMRSVAEGKIRLTTG
jgi:hypothetical protein